jgi:hypothetical protein
MSEHPTCGQKDCDRPAIGRFTWPGRPEALICASHLTKLQQTAKALDLELVVYTVPPFDELGEEWSNHPTRGVWR